MKKQCFGVAIAAMLAMSTASAATMVLEGNYVKIGLNDVGTLGSFDSNPPGIQYDNTGTHSFGIDDYLTPGSPFEGFYLESNQGNYGVNNQTYGHAVRGTLTDLSSGSLHKVSWNASIGSLFSITHIYSFSDDSKRINVQTMITALTDLTGLKFLRTLDPDPDVNTYGSYNTKNGQGTDKVAAENWVHAVGEQTGLVIGLYSNSSVTHNTGISSGWSTNPSDFLSGRNDGAYGDYTIGMGFDIGSLMSGQSIVLDYAYVMGGSLDDADIPSGVPEPHILALFGFGLLGMLGLRRRYKC